MRLKKVMFLLLLLIGSLVSHTGYGRQDEEKKEKEPRALIKANYYYAHFAFARAIPYYESVIADTGSAEIFARLADCYRLTGQIEPAAENYKNALDKQHYSYIVMLRYGQMLMQLGRYDEALKWLQAYQKTNPRDARVANLILGCQMAPEKLRAAPKKPPLLLSLNTDRSEFAPVLWNGNLVYTADTAVNVNKVNSSWTGSTCYNMFMTPADSEGNCGSEVTSLLTVNNPAWYDGPCSFSSKGDTMYFTRTKYNDGMFRRGVAVNANNTVVLEIMMATDYDASNHSFRKIKPFRFNNRNHVVAHPALSPNGSMLVFSSTMAGNGSELFVCTKNKKGKWLLPVRLPASINTEGDEVFPHFANDTTLFFASDGLVGFGGLDIYQTHFHMNKDKFVFSVPENVGLPYNSSYDDMSMALKADWSSGYFSSSRPAAVAGDNIYFYKSSRK